MSLKSSLKLSPKPQQKLTLKQKLLMGALGGAILMVAGVLGVKAVTATYTISGYAFLDYNGDQAENGEDKRLPVLTVNVYSDEDDSGTYSTGDLHLGSDLSDSLGNYAIDLSTGTNTLSTRLMSDKDDAEEDVSTGAINLTSSDLQLMKLGPVVQTVGIRFGSVSLPAGATVTAAYIRFQAKNTNTSSKTYTIQGEKVVFSDPITKADSNISKRITTTNSASWTVSTWNAESYYSTADLTSVVNEIRNQGGWVPGNPMMFIFSGTEGIKSAYAGTEKGPELYIDYTLPAMTHDFIIMPATDWLSPGSTAGETLIPPGSATYVAASYEGEALTCYAVSDYDPNTLLHINRISGMNAEASDTARANDIEAIAYDASRSVLFAADGDRLGTMDLVNGIFTAKSDTFGKPFGALGTKSVTNADGMSLDPFRMKVYVTNRESGNDILFIADTATGKYIPDAFGADEDYVEISGTGIQKDIDDIAFSPVDGKLYGINNGDAGKDYDFLVEIDKTNGVSTIVDTLKFDGAYLTDIEGLSFSNYGTLIGSTGDGGGTSNANALYEINIATAAATLIGRFGPSNDYEACECLTAAVNRLEGYVFDDLNSDAVYNGGDAPLPGVRVRIYIDTDWSRTLSPGDVLMDSVNSDGSGFYSWVTASNQDFVTEVVTATAPPNYVLTTVGDWDVLFNQNFGGTTDTDNDFGLVDGAAFPIEGLSFTAEWEEASALLNWTTSLEFNTSHFIIERSPDEHDFTPLGKVTAAGNTSSSSFYKYSDREAGSIRENILYYRLRQVDLDGKFVFSKVVELNRIDQDLALSFSLFPNPAADWVQIEVTGLYYKDNGILKVINAKGQIIEKLVFAPDMHMKTLQTEKWPSGLYTIVLTNDLESVSKKLIVK